MARTHSPLTRELLCFVYDRGEISSRDLKNYFVQKSDRWSDFLFRLEKQGMITRVSSVISLTDEARQLVELWRPQTDGVWKLVIFDIPEKHRYVRNHLREKLRSLGFKQWQGSTWVTPYKMPSGLVEDLEMLGQKYFVRLIFVDRINITTDLEKLFPRTVL